MDLVFHKFPIKVVKNEKATYSIADLKDYIEYVDFIPKRFYTIQDCQMDTGQHCHKIEQELFVMLKGKCTAVIDRGNGKEDIPLEGPGDAIYTGNYVWHGFKDFSPDALLLAVSSTNFSPDRSDYIEDYEEYQKVIKS